MVRRLMESAKHRDLVLVAIACSLITAAGYHSAFGQLTPPTPPLIPFDGTTPNNVAATLNLQDKMALLTGDYNYCSKTGLTDPNMSDKCRTFMNTLDEHLNIMMTGTAQNSDGK